MYKKFLAFVVIAITFILANPLSVRAIVVCSDGWVSSCSSVHSGCCSHHGGVDSSSSDYAYDEYSYSSGGNDDNDDDNILSSIASVLGFIVVGVFTIAAIMDLLGL